MTNLYVCSGCNCLFLCDDEELVSRRNGHCSECTRRDLLEMVGLPRDFLSRRLGPS